MAEQANWYVAHTYSGYENKVATDLMTMVENRHLQDLICDIKVPSAATRPARKRFSRSSTPATSLSKWS